MWQTWKSSNEFDGLRLAGNDVKVSNFETGETATGFWHSNINWQCDQVLRRILAQNYPKAAQIQGELVFTNKLFLSKWPIPIAAKYLGNFCLKIRRNELHKMAQSGHTER